MQVPTRYDSGYRRVYASNPTLARCYVRHTTLSDPPADAAVEALAPYPAPEAARLIRSSMEQDATALRKAPPELQAFFAGVETPPSWFDPTTARPAYCAFHGYSDLFLAALVADGIVRGFSTLISRSFFLTGRLTDHHVRRLRQNIQHLIDIMLPGGLERDGDGWKRTVRIRLVHAQTRRLLRLSGKWDEAEFGAPLSATHLALSSAAFSAILMNSAMRLGAVMTAEERVGYMHVWRYTGWLLGVPRDLLFRNEAEALELFRVGAGCEPPPDYEAISMAHTIINVAPRVAGIRDPTAQRNMAAYVYRVSRALIGNELADRLRFPKQRTLGLLPFLRWQRRLERLLDRMAPGGAHKRRSAKFIALLENSALPDAAIGYRLPDRLSTEESTW